MTAEQLDRIEHYRQFLDKGFVNTNGIVDLYNEVFGASSTGRKQHYTSCGSCIRRLLKQLIQAAVDAKIEEIPDEPIGPESDSEGKKEVPTLEPEKKPEPKKGEKKK